MTTCCVACSAAPLFRCSAHLVSGVGLGRAQAGGRLWQLSAGASLIGIPMLGPHFHDVSSTLWRAQQAALPGFHSSR